MQTNIAQRSEPVDFQTVNVLIHQAPQTSDSTVPNLTGIGKSDPENSHLTFPVTTTLRIGETLRPRCSRPEDY
ncbi:MAG TPA: hypothetical protein DCX79_18950 [Planctomycetaceae bacterium]|nr:hypothetical protein [Planctomycetaceae bacterium]